MTVGVLGGGQLARMLGLAGVPLGLRFAFLDPASDACAFALGEALCGDYDDERLLERLAERSTVVTYEFENVPAGSARLLAEHTQVYPPAEALAVKQDRLAEKRLFEELGIPVPAHRPVSGRAELEQARSVLGPRLVLKTRSHGYDGKGQARIRTDAELGPALERLGDRPLVAEREVGFSRELSIIAVRGRSGECTFYPLTENVHHRGILLSSRPRPGDPREARARDYAGRLLDRLGYVGALALELFEEGDELLANELAPRVHNSGHWSIEGAETSQFENHLRAILGLPLGATSLVGVVAMRNCVGRLPDRERVLAIPGAHLHAYDKPARPGRKVGHVTLRVASEAELEKSWPRLEDAVGPPLVEV